MRSTCCGMGPYDACISPTQPGQLLKCWVCHAACNPGRFCSPRPCPLRSWRVEVQSPDPRCQHPLLPISSTFIHSTGVPICCGVAQQHKKLGQPLALAENQAGASLLSPSCLGKEALWRLAEASRACNARWTLSVEPPLLPLISFVPVPDSCTNLPRASHSEKKNNISATEPSCPPAAAGDKATVVASHHGWLMATRNIETYFS